MQASWYYRGSAAVMATMWSIATSSDFASVSFLDAKEGVAVYKNDVLAESG